MHLINVNSGHKWLWCWDPTSDMNGTAAATREAPDLWFWHSVVELCHSQFSLQTAKKSDNLNVSSSKGRFYVFYSNDDVLSFLRRAWKGSLRKHNTNGNGYKLVPLPTSFDLSSPVHWQPLGHLITKERTFLSVALSRKMSFEVKDKGKSKQTANSLFFPFKKETRNILANLALKFWNYASL